MTLAETRPYIQYFLKMFIIAGAIKFLMDEFVFKKTFEPYSFLFFAIWMALIFTWLYYRRRKKAESEQAEG